MYRASNTGFDEITETTGMHIGQCLLATLASLSAAQSVPRFSLTRIWRLTTKEPCVEAGNSTGCRVVVTESRLLKAANALTQHGPPSLTLAHIPHLHGLDQFPVQKPCCGLTCWLMFSPVRNLT